MTATRPPTLASYVPLGEAVPNERAPARPHYASRLTWRIFLATAAVVTLVMAVALVLLSLSAQRTADASIARGLDQTRRHIGALIEGRQRALESGALVFALNPNFVSLLLKPRPEDMLDQSREAVARIGATWVQITDDQGVRLAKSDEPTAPMQSLAGFALIGMALGGEVANGIGVTGDSALFFAVAVPIRSGLRALGVLMAAQSMDSSLAAAVKESSGSDVVFYATDGGGAAHVAASTLGAPPAMKTYLDARGRAPADTGRGDSPKRTDLRLGDMHYVVEETPLRSASGEVLGGYLALRSRDVEMAPFAALRRGIFASGAIGLAIAFALSYLVAHRISRPLRSLIEVAQRAAQGDYSPLAQQRADDEIGTLQGAMSGMLSDLRDKQALAAILTGAPTSVADYSSPAPAWQGDIVPGMKLARRYSIVDVLGAGGMGRVYKAIDDELEEPIAIKVLKLEAAFADPAALERLKSEIRLARRISHRNVVRTHDFGEEDGLYFITMEYVAGSTLRAVLDERRRLPVPATLAVARQLCRALEVAHEQGVIHRDIKPQNLMVQPDGVLKVMDFGVARPAVRDRAMTQTGAAVGTPDYMPPEQFLGEDTDARADLYAAGMVIYECLTGQRPFAGATIFERLNRILTETPPSPGALNPEVPSSLSLMVMRMLAPDREHRPRSAAELSDLLAAEGERAAVAGAAAAH